MSGPGNAKRRPTPQPRWEVCDAGRRWCGGGAEPVTYDPESMTGRTWRWGVALAASEFTPRPLRRRIYDRLGLDIRTDVDWIRTGLFVMGPQLAVGEGTFINHQCFVENEDAPVTIGRNCQIGMRVLLCTATHEVGPHEKRGGKDVKGPIDIGDGVWIGAGASVMPGVTVGDGCVIAAGAVVVKGCEPDGLYAGVPARRVRDLD